VTVAILVVVAAVASTGRGPTDEECAEEWKRAKNECNKLLYGQDPPREVVGPRMTMTDCMANHVRDVCGGKKIDWDKSPQYDKSRPGRRF